MKRTTSSKKITPPEQASSTRRDAGDIVATADTPRDESTARSNDDFIRMMAKLVAEVNNSGKTAEEPKPKRTKKAPEVIIPESTPTEPHVPVAEPRPKKQLTEKQLSALAAGRAKNSRFRPRN